MRNIRLISDDELYHFNKNHDELGRFAKGHTGNRKLDNYQQKLNLSSYNESKSRVALNNAKQEADKYRRDSAKYPARNIYYKAMRKAAQRQLDSNVYKLQKINNVDRKQTNKILKKVGNVKGAKINVYLKDIYGTEFDVYKLELNDKK